MMIVCQTHIVNDDYNVGDDDHFGDNDEDFGDSYAVGHRDDDDEFGIDDDDGEAGRWNTHRCNTEFQYLFPSFNCESL